MQQHPRRALAIAAVLAGVAGYVDAIGFLGTGGMFVSFMSGNSTQAAVGVETGRWEVAGVGAALVGSFVVGVAGAALLGHRAAQQSDDARRTRLILGATAACLLAAAGMLAAALGGVWAYTAVAAGMGALNVIFADETRARVAVTYATGSLVSFGLGIAGMITGRSRTAWRRPLLLWTSLVSGAVLGSAATGWLGWPALLAAVGVVAVVAALPSRVLSR
ncbi:YoaK family protein [Microbacterium sp. RD1]|uniref:YoaK family protein n=1 Tax=Microbacterium sp. RD1 TaxID=3457313 RepID=UPI003FA5BE80